MPFTLTMPKLSPTMEEGTLVKWTKAVGDFVETGDVLFEVATDKATVEHSALDEGWLRKIIVDEGGEARVNQAVAVFTEEKDEDIASYKPEGLAEEVREEVEELSVEPEAAKERKQVVAAGAMSQPAFTPEAPLEKVSYAAPQQRERLATSPLARRVAREKGIDLLSVKGSGPRGRVMSRDLDLGQPVAPVSFTQQEGPKLPPGSYVEEKMMPMRKVIGQRLQESKTFIPHFYVQQDIDVASLMEQRLQLKANGVKVSVNDMIVRACALALREHPNVNSGYNSVNQSFIRYQTIDISIAVSVDGGLITPIVRHADYKNLGELSSEIRHLAQQAQKGKLLEHEYKGGSFTVSNLGMYGITDFQAVINPPQGAILAVSGVRQTPIVKNGQVVPGQLMSVTLSSDHRVIDGVLAAEFVQTLKKYLEAPAILLL
jgi:pyruvate dehydrogenase E2 component (dihydrolipoamide acetyltransferase)